jgi:hypothetical protein
MHEKNKKVELLAIAGRNLFNAKREVVQDNSQDNKEEEDKRVSGSDFEEKDLRN